MTSQPAFILHSRPYRESSVLADFFTPQGRLRAAMRSARGKSGSLARPFVPLELVLRGRSELKSVARLESNGSPRWLTGTSLFGGLYLNELLIRLLPPEDPFPSLFEHYSLTLDALAAGRPLEPLLRAFEWRLLVELGYGFSLDRDLNGQSVQVRRLYRLLPDVGLEPVDQLQPGLFNGGELLAMAEADWRFPGALAAAKRLMRQALVPHLGGRPLVSRELFTNLKESSRD
ncbi:DNA repair protein RecO [Azorhizophilus paspali]|uniref:DNA repair protein RecO n=1 Tax=Azorhizophilus paspali TaxID=69963 RepID=A0ABV6SQ12_AZOPA